MDWQKPRRNWIKQPPNDAHINEDIVKLYPRSLPISSFQLLPAAFIYLKFKLTNN